MDNTTNPNNGEFGDEAANAAPARPSSAERARDLASVLDEKARDAASVVATKAEEAASYVGHTAEEAGAAVGGGLRSLGQAVRDHAPEGGMAGNASTAVADTLESGGRYLEEEGLKDMAEDVTNVIRRNPIQALLLGVVAGFLIAKAITPRS